MGTDPEQGQPGTLICSTHHPDERRAGRLNAVQEVWQTWLLLSKVLTLLSLGESYSLDC